MNKLLIFIVCSVAIYFGFFALGLNSTIATYEFYMHDDPNNCNSPLAKTPILFKFSYKKETNEMFRTVIYEGKQDIVKLENCSILDDKNWRCGGEFVAPFTTEIYSVVDGVISYQHMKTNGIGPICPPKIIKR